LDPTSTLVDQDYVMGLGREADPGGLKFWTDQIESGGMTAEDFRQLLVASGEFQSQHGSQSNWDYVSDLYLKGLGRYPELDGGAFWAGHLNDGTLSRSDVLGALAQSPEGQQHFALSH